MRTLVPVRHMTILFREFLTWDVLSEVFVGAPSETMKSFRTNICFDLGLGGFSFDAGICLLYVLRVTTLFFVIAVIEIRRK